VTLGRPLPDPAWSMATNERRSGGRSVDEIVHWNVWRAVGPACDTRPKAKQPATRDVGLPLF
jgi:hypothetical protein